MKSSELRIGNIIDVGSDNIIDRVKDIVNNWLICEHCKIKTEHAEGIILSEEWLKAFGFELWGNVSVNQYESYERWVLFNAVDGTSNFEVHIITSSYGNMIDKEIVYSVDDDERQRFLETNNVHNLQNAFYFITGNELHLNERRPTNE